ncbi:hypothetical protein MASR2M117_13860 [Paludibacter sp.]
MKKLITILCVALIATFSGKNLMAANFSALEGTNYHIIWLDADTDDEFEISKKADQDLRVNWDNATNPNGEKALYIWENTYASVAPAGKGVFGQIGGFMTFDAVGGWSGLGFCMRDGLATTYNVDYRSVTDEYHFHMAVQSTYSKPHMIQVFGGKEETTAAKFSVGVGEMESKPNITPNFKTDGSWNVIDIPVSQLKTYGFSNRSTFTGNYFVILSGGIPNRISFDAVFFYKPKASGVNNVKADKLDVLVTNQIVEVMNATAPVEIFDVTGTLVKKSSEPIFSKSEFNKGVYIIKSGSATAKILIK